MPKLGQYLPLLKSVFFLYATEEDARAGKNSGGTGFLVGLPSEVQGRTYIYGVTNWHVACDGFPVVRLNRKVGPPEIFDFSPDQWAYEPGGPDLAVISIKIDAAEHDVRFISFSMGQSTLNQEKSDPFNVGDDVFMIGRFIDYDGAETNMPALRFGNISIMGANLKQETGYLGPAIVLDMHSRTGFSGSPVFAYRTSGSHFAKASPGPLTGLEEIVLGHTLMLLGIHFGQFPELWQIGADPSAKKEASLLTDGSYVKGLSGMTTVIPDSDLWALLDRKDIADMRKKSDETLKHSHAVMTEVVSESAGAGKAQAALDDANPDHKEDFMSLLSAAAKGRSPKGQT